MKNILNLLQEMTPEQKEPLSKILGLKHQSDSEIIKKFSKMLLPAKGWLQEAMNYNQMLKSIAEKNDEVINFSKGTLIAEKELYLELFQNEFEKLSDEGKQEIIAELEKAGLNKDQISSLSGLTAISVAQLSGFGIYMLASTTLGAITSMLGLTLPFAFYTGMSSAISFINGPVGFLVMGVMIYRSFRHVKSWEEVQEILKGSWVEIINLISGDYDRATQCFKYLAASRIVLEQNFEEEKTKFAKMTKETEVKGYELQNKITQKSNEVRGIENNLNDRIAAMKRVENEIQDKHRELNQINAQISLVKERISQNHFKQEDLKLEKNVLQEELIKSKRVLNY